MPRITRDGLERGSEAGSAAGLIISVIVWLIAVAGFFFLGVPFLASLGADHATALEISLMFSIVAAILLPLGGIVLGGIAGIVLSAIDAKLPGRSLVRKGAAVGLLFSFPLILFQLTTVHVDAPPLLQFIGLLPLSMIFAGYGALHGAFCQRLSEPAKKTFLRRFMSSKFGTVVFVSAILLLIVTGVLLSQLLAPLLKNLAP